MSLSNIHKICKWAPPAPAHQSDDGGSLYREQEGLLLLTEQYELLLVEPNYLAETVSLIAKLDLNVSKCLNYRNLCLYSLDAYSSTLNFFF